MQVGRTWLWVSICAGAACAAGLLYLGATKKNVVAPAGAPGAELELFAEPIAESEPSSLTDELPEIEIQWFVEDDLNVADRPLRCIREPSELQFSCAGVISPAEERAADLLHQGARGERIDAATRLWEGRSRYYANDVIAFVEQQPGDEESYRRLRAKIEGSLSLEGIRKELRDAHQEWGIWLAFLRPHKDLVPDLLECLAAGKHKQDAMLALGKSQDERAFEPLLAILKEGDYQMSGFAASALGYLGDERAEPALIEALSYRAWPQVNACEALAKIGSVAAVPELERLAADNRYRGALSIQETADSALKAIQQRADRK